MSSVFDDMTDSERRVASFLTELGLKWVYEFPVFVYDEKDRPRVWTPDFYIPKLGMHIEVCGSEDFNYRYREEIYEKNGYYVVFLHIYKQPEKWKNFLIARIREIEESRHTEVLKISDFTYSR
ncbi:MAG: hypothetical protein QXN36_00675 [Candidatus Bathyarchaeia archaeon]